MAKTRSDNPLSDDLVIGITMGDPGGIGPEIIIKALADPHIRKQARFIVYGMEDLLEYAADAQEVQPFWYRQQHERIERNFPRQVALADYDEYAVPAWQHTPGKQAGEASLRFCMDAVEAAKNGTIDALVTAPISKTSWKMADGKFPGHTELLADRCKSPRKAMMFVGGDLKLALATIHEPLFEIRHKFTIGLVFEPIDLLNTALHDFFEIAQPRIAVCGLNPHAGEGGQFGDEEQRIITPAITMANEVGIRASGPYPADTIFNRVVSGEFDGVVAMYHDQGLIPVKMLAFHNAVNVTIGLPIIRTSPAHGTAFDIAGKGLANAASMKSAIQTAIDMARTRKRKQGT